MIRAENSRSGDRRVGPFSFRWAALAAALATPAATAGGCSDGEATSTGGATATSATTGSGGAGGPGSATTGTGGEGGMGGAGGAGGDGGSSVSVQILAFNDFHGNLEPPAGSAGKIKLPDMTEILAGGAAYFASHIAALRLQNPNTVVVSAGDLIGASPLVSSLFYDEPTIEAMNLIGLEIHGVGNHEFDKGTSELLRMQYGGCNPVGGCTDGTSFTGATFRFLAANVVVDTKTGKTLFPAYEIKELEGVKVGFIGLTLEDTPSIVTPLGVAGLSFTGEVDTINALVPELQAKGVEAIVVVIHEGGFQTGLFDECPGMSGPIVEIATNVSDAVDVLVTGHTHQAYNCIIDEKIVTSAASSGRIVTDIDLEIDKTTGHVKTKSAKNIVATRDVMPDGPIEQLVTEYVALAAPLANKVVGAITATIDREVPPMGSGISPMGLVIADAQLAATQAPAFGGAQIAFMNPGGVRADLVYDDNGTPADPSDDGSVTYGDTFAVQPFGNSLVVMTLTGDQIKTLLEQQFQLDGKGNPVSRILQVSQGFTYTYSLSAPMGSKVDPASMMLNGAPIDPSKSYRVTVNSFMATGGDTFTILISGTDRLGGVVDLEALQAYFAASSPVAPPALDRVTVVP
jgi:5'-nucleotidase